MAVSRLLWAVFLMKRRDKIILSIIAGLLAMMLSSGPMWWGVLFSPITRQLAAAPLCEDVGSWLRWESDGVVLRFKSLDLLFSFLRG